MRIPSSLSSRLVLTAVGLVALVGLLVSLTTALVMREFLTSRLDQDVQRTTVRALDFFRGDQGPAPPPGELDQRRAIADTGSVLAFLASTGGASQGAWIDRDRQLHELSDSALEELAEVPVDGEVHQISLPGIGGVRVVAEAAPGTDGVVVSGLWTEDVEETTQSLLLWELALTVVGVVGALLLGQLLVRRTLQPLREVAAAAHQVTQLPLDSGSVGETVRVPDRLTDERTEVGQVGAALNRLLGHVENALDARHRSEQQVRQFVADASHELRTPLTTIRGYAELAGRKPDELPSSMTKVSEESERMSALVDDLLLLARLDSGRPLAAEPVDLTRLVMAAVDDARVVAPSHQWALSLPTEPVLVNGDEHRLHQVVTNLLGNARRHTPEGTVVTTSLAVQDGGVTLAVHDTGPGIPAGVDVFERFTRGDTSRARASGGAGLGLSLVAAIVTAHRGTVDVDSRVGSTTFTVRLPG